MSDDRRTFLDYNEEDEGVFMRLSKCMGVHAWLCLTSIFVHVTNILC